ncbi:MAG: DUF4256 domain-containing protein [Myxococcota bacterium]
MAKTGHGGHHTLSARVAAALLQTLQARFEQHQERHLGLAWDVVASRLTEAPAKLWSLQEMESSGGEPDVIGREEHTGEILFADCCQESPVGRRSVCYDGAALRSRKANKPKTSALELAEAMGVELLSEARYRALQQLVACDTKTSSWVVTPEDIRQLGGALFCDRRYGKVFTYHNGAESYYAARGFRALLRV